MKNDIVWISHSPDIQDKAVRVCRYPREITLVVVKKLDHSFLPVYAIIVSNMLRYSLMAPVVQKNNIRNPVAAWGRVSFAGLKICHSTAFM